MVVSEHVLRRILCLASQPTKVACCLASKSLSRAVMHPSVWTGAATVVYTPDSHALEFLGLVQPVHVHLWESDVDRVEWFLDGMISRGLHLVVRRLELALGHTTFRRRHALIDCIAEFVELESVQIRCDSVSHMACMAFPNGCKLPKLRILSIVESVAGARKLEVYFDDADLPQLQEVDLRVFTSDIMAQVWRLDSLRSISYSCGMEGFEDARLDGAMLSHLSLNVASSKVFDRLVPALAKVRHVDSLTLTCDADDILLDTHLAVKNLCIEVTDPEALVSIVHAVVRCMSSVTIRATGYALERPSAHGWTVRFVGTGSWHNFHLWMLRTALTIGQAGTFIVES